LNAAFQLFICSPTQKSIPSVGRPSIRYNDKSRLHGTTLDDVGGSVCFVQTSGFFTVIKVKGNICALEMLPT
jgi:hypothetical protein